jgi:hypothetical protein
MKNLTTILISFFLISISAGHAQNSNWQELFNGKNLEGWKTLNGDAKYYTENNEIIGVSKTETANSFLVTDKEYTNFVLEYEMKMDEGLNSGVQVRSHSLETFKDGKVHGPQIECEDTDRGWAGGLYDESRKGWRYPLEYNPSAKKAYIKGKWNKFKVVCFNNQILTWLNGIACANLIEDEIETGFIGLQVHSIGKNLEMNGKLVHWRSIRLREASINDLAGNNAPVVSYLNNQLTKEELALGWKLLWDGKTSTGWRSAKSDKFPEKGWLIKDGTLTVEKNNGAESINGGDIITVDKYKNFELEVDFLMTEGANSGIKYFVDPDLNKGPGSSIGCEFQILDDKTHPDAKAGVNGNRTLASLYDLIKANGKEFNPYLPKEKYVNDLGQWNRARIVVNGKHVEHYLNGCKVVEYERDTQMWRALVAYSKYKDWPNFGSLEEGYILLQEHGSQVSFKNIKIRVLR